MAATIQTRRARLDGGFGALRRGRRTGLLDGRQVQREGASLPWLRVDGDVAALQACELASEVEAKTGPGQVIGPGVGDAPEAREQDRQVGGRDADASVFHCYASQPAPQRDCAGHLAAVRRVFERVVDEVGDDG